MSSIFAYTIVHDHGFAPNPFGGLLTLATCKPMIRRVAKPGDWLFGTGSSRAIGAGKLVYAARVSAVISLEDYGASPLYEFKRPRASGDWQRHGDNIYCRAADGSWQQRRGIHHNQQHMARDLSGRNVLLSDRFWYFGAAARLVPPEFSILVRQAPGHRRLREASLIHALEVWLKEAPGGCVGDPSGGP